MLPRFLMVFACLVSLAWTCRAQGSDPRAQEYYRAGYLASMAREWDAATGLFTRSLELDPQNLEVYFQRAASLQMADRIDEAIADYERILESKPDHYLTLEYLAKLYETKGEYEKAVNLYARALPLVSDAKWKSVVRWWMSQAKDRIQPAGRTQDNNSNRSRRNRTQDTGGIDR